MIRIPDWEIRIETARSGGPGGQNVNKVSSKVQLRWHVGASSVFTLEQKAKILQILNNRININGELMIDVDEERSQSQNREVAIERLHKLVTQALTPKKKRRKTKPTYASKMKRVESKKKTSEKKQARRIQMRDSGSLV